MRCTKMALFGCFVGCGEGYPEGFFCLVGKMALSPLTEKRLQIFLWYGNLVGGWRR